VKAIGTAEERALARRIALKIKRRVPAHVPEEDLLQAALIGLWDALRKMPRDITEAHRIAYLKLRIAGRVIDELRALDWFTRSARKTHNLQMHHAEPSKERIPDRAHTPEELFLADTEVARAMGALDARRRGVVEAIVVGHRQRAIGERMGISEPRVNQLYHSALADMRVELER